MIPIPTLQSDRLLLRGFAITDLDAYAEMMAGAVTRQFLGGAPLSREASWRELCAALGHWHLLGYGFFAVVEKASGNVIGRVGPHDPEGLPEVELGWMIEPAAGGKGYATEAARMAADWFFAKFDRYDSLISLIDKNNIASQMVARKLGSVNTDQIFTHWQDGPLDIWRLNRPNGERG